MEFGKIIKHESYFDGRLKTSKTEYSVPILITDRAGALTEIMKCLELITSKQTCNVTINIKADPKSHKLKLLTKNYIIE
jgi:hypothetical protein